MYTNAIMIFLLFSETLTLTMTGFAIFSGMSKDDIDAVVMKDHLQSRVPTLPGGYSVLDTFPDESTTGHWDRHSLIIKVRFIPPLFNYRITPNKRPPGVLQN